MIANVRFLEILQPVEARFRHQYGEAEAGMLYKTFGKKLDDKQWEKLCELMIRKGGGFLPPVEQWSIMYAAKKDAFGLQNRKWSYCDKCSSRGLVMYLHRDEKEMHGTPPARCTCVNGEVYESFPTMVEVEKFPGFIRFLGKHESLSEAISKADKAGSVEDPEKDRVPF